MITIAEVIEQAALKVDHILKPGGGTYGDAIRALAAQYEGCIVADTNMHTGVYFHTRDGVALLFLPMKEAKE